MRCTQIIAGLLHIMFQVTGGNEDNYNMAKKLLTCIERQYTNRQFRGKRVYQHT